MMNKLNEMVLKTLIKARYSQKGASMIEYVLLASLISIVAIALMTTVGTQIKAVFTKIVAALSV
jgi:Flp pilus assembly pilin Flp